MNLHEVCTDIILRSLNNGIQFPVLTNYLITFSANTKCLMRVARNSPEMSYSILERHNAKYTVLKDLSGKIFPFKSQYPKILLEKFKVIHMYQSGYRERFIVIHLILYDV